MLSSVFKTTRTQRCSSVVLRRLISTKSPNPSSSVLSGEDQNSPPSSSTSSHGHSVVDSKDQKNKKKVSKYVAFKDFPKRPDSDYKQMGDPLSRYESPEQLVSSPLLSSSESISLQAKKLEDQDEILNKIQTKAYHTFDIPIEYLSGYEPNVKDKLLNDIIYDSVDDNLPPHSEHPLKSTWSGMMPLNPGLGSIGNKYLWKLFPEEKLFNVKPFGDYKQSETLNSYNNWVNQQRNEEKVKTMKIFEEKKKALDDMNVLNEKKSFYTVSGGRKKLNRTLLKQYKKSKEELLGKDDPDNDKE